MIKLKNEMQDDYLVLTDANSQVIIVPGEVCEIEADYFKLNKNCRINIASSLSTETRKKKTADVLKKALPLM